MSDLRDLAKSMNITARVIEGRAVDLVKTVFQNVGTTVVYSTPIDTSRARMNWQATENQPANGVILPYPAKPSDSSVGSSTALANIRKIANNYTGSPNGLFLTNNVNYIQLLNNGSSNQAPRNFVAKSVITAAQSIKNIKLLP